MTNIQYISITHTSKDEAKHNKQLCNTLHTVYFKQCNFDEVCELLDAGCTVGRVGTTTDFVAIDVDNSTVNINQVYEAFKNNDDIHVSYSSSMNPLKYHILVNLHRTITIDEYKKIINEEFTKIRDAVCGRCDVFELDTHADNFYQCFFGQSVETSIEYIIDGSRRLYNWTKKDAEPRYYIENKETKLHPSMNSADYCRKNGLLTVEEDKRFDLILPSMTNGRMKKIAEGGRYSWAKMTGAKLLMRIFYLNHKFNEGWTKWDYLESFEWVVRSNVVKADEFCKSEDYKGLERFFDNKWDILMDKSFGDICSTLEPYFNSSKRQYRSRQYTPTMITAIINDHVNGNDVVFDDEEYLKNICNELKLNYYRTVSTIKGLGYNVIFVTVKTKKNCLSGYVIEDGEVIIPKDEVTNTIKVYCSRNNIKIKRI